MTLNPVRSRIVPIIVGIGLIEAVAFAWARLWARALDGDALFGLDLDAYRQAAVRLIATGSPYHEALVTGPIDNRIQNVPIAYLYPPPLAQVFVPVVSVSPALVAAVWAIVQIAALMALLPLLYRRFGGALTPTSVCATWIVAVLSFPLNFAVYIGNLSGWIAIAIAVMLLGPGRPAGVAAAVMAVAKMTPAVLLVPAIIRRESRVGAMIGVTAITAASVVIAPFAWSQWLRVLPNVLRFPAGSDVSNLAPGAVLGTLGFPTAGIVLGLTLAGVALAATVVLAIRGSWAGSVAAATAVLLFAPATIWNHYIAILLPVLVAAWPGSDGRTRTTFVLFMLVTASGWLELESQLPVRMAYVAVTVVAAGAATVSLANRGADAPSATTALA